MGHPVVADGIPGKEIAASSRTQTTLANSSRSLYSTTRHVHWRLEFLVKSWETVDVILMASTRSQVGTKNELLTVALAVIESLEDECKFQGRPTVNCSGS